MFSFIKRWLAQDSKKQLMRANAATSAPIVQSGQSRQQRVTDAYYEAMAQVQGAIAHHDFEQAAKMVRKSMDLIPGWVREQVRDYGPFQIGSIPALQQGGTALALVGDSEGLTKMHSLVCSMPELEPWAAGVEEHQNDLRLFQRIKDHVAANPGCVQTDMKGQLGLPDGRRAALLVSYLEKAGMIARIPAGRTYKLLPADSPEVPEPAPERAVGTHRTAESCPPLKEIHTADLTYIPLPRAPLRWEETAAGRQKVGFKEATADFEVHDADWHINSLEKIPPTERPDTAFRSLYPTSSGVFMIDNTGNASGLGNIEAAALHFDRKGLMIATKALLHNVYRIGVHPMGKGFIALSQDCVLHAYDDALEPIFETNLALAPEIVALKKRFGVSDDRFKNHIRCVALSRDAGRYLFTAVDEAWCIDAKGRGLWGAKLPIKEGWKPTQQTSTGTGTSAEIERALALIGLSLPVTADDLKSRYRELAKQWHPDLNRANPRAGDQMTALNAAMETLTGIDASAVPRFAGMTFTRELEKTEVDVSGFKLTMTLGMTVGEIHAADWIYAASFAASSNHVYLAGYSGRVVEVDDHGNGVRVYDIGTVPKCIVDTGEFLYLLTDTRLYVLRAEALHAVVDVFEGGELFVAQTGFEFWKRSACAGSRRTGISSAASSRKTRSGVSIRRREA